MNNKVHLISERINIKLGIFTVKSNTSTLKMFNMLIYFYFIKLLK